MWHLTRLALRNRFVTLLLALAVAATSVIAFMGLKTELIPDISFPYTTVITIYPQATPDIVVNEVSAPVERLIWDEWSGKGLKHVTSTSAAGMSVVMAEFEFGTDMNKVINSLNAGVAKLTLPAAVTELPKLMTSISKNPQIIPINMNIMPLMTLNLSGNLNPEQLRQIADTQIVPELSKVKGVLRVDIEGGDKEQVVIAPDPADMNRYGISMSQIAGLLNNEYTSLVEVENTFLNRDGVKLSDVAKVSKSPPPSTAITRIDGRPSVGISVTKTEESNIVETAAAVNKKIVELEEKIGNGVTVSTTFDQSNFIKQSVNQLWEKAIIGAILAVLVVFFFLWAVRASLITAISIPFSLFIGFLCMKLAGITLNLLTLSAVTIAVGRLIDDSIVMVEIVYRRLRRGENFKEAAIGGAKEIATPITTATLATVAIFIPLMFVGGIVGEMFIPFALTVTFAMLASLLVALMLIPALAQFLVSAKPKIVEIRDNWYQKIYVKSLKWTLGHRIAVIITAVVLLIGSIGLLGITGTSFMSGSMGEATITINIAMPANTDINSTNGTAAKVEKLLGSNDAVRTYETTIGSSTTSMSGIISASQGAGGSNTATIVVYLKSGADLNQTLTEIDQACRGIEESQYVMVSGGDSGASLGIASSSLNLSIQGDDQKNIAMVTAQLMEKLQKLDGIKDLSSDLTTVAPKLNISVDPVKIATSGLAPEQLPLLQQEFMLLMNGATVPGKTVKIDNEGYSIYIKAIVQNLTSLEEAQNLKIGFPQSVALNDIASVTIQELPSHVIHTDTMLSATISGTITDKDVGTVNQAVQKEINSLPAHPGVVIKAAGITEMMNETFTRMFIAILIAIVIVFAVVILMMRSFINPLIIMISLPLAFIGSVLALLISGYTLGVSAMMGLLMLVGIVLTNAIVLVSMVEQQRKNGASIKDALVEGGKTRLRPILMTALCTILAMIPMALNVSSGTMLSAELAIVVIGGMVSSTFLTLFVIPAVYSLIHREKKQRTAA
jgi:hydrophobic/amphiphilic exporter-1 (mainly G- bacteria), HAE1 family